MTHFNEIVVGSGISGMTIALLLAQSGRKVLLLEKQGNIGGCMRRFQRKGVFFDTGFHFTGGLGGGLLSDMLDALGIGGEIIPQPLHTPEQNRVYIEDQDRLFGFPHGHENVAEAFRQFFPNETNAVKAYFRKEQEVEDNTPFMTLSKLNELELQDLMLRIDEDMIGTLGYLNGLTENRTLSALLGAFALCYGSPLSTTSLATHCRISVGLHRSLDRVQGGGDAFINAFLKKAAGYGIEIRTGTSVKKILNPTRRSAREVELTDGSSCTFDNMIMTVHPREIVSMMPPEINTSELRRMTGSFRETVSFNSIFACLDSETPVKPELTSVMTSDRIEKILNNQDGETAMALLTENQIVNGKNVPVVCAFETASVNSADKWKNVAKRHSCAEYCEYKEAVKERLIAKVMKVHPEFKGSLKVMDASTPLTFADYVPPLGSAYGICHDLNEFGIFGRLPIRNIYAAGQSALLPGVIGAMLSSFITARFILGKGFLR